MAPGQDGAADTRAVVVTSVVTVVAVVLTLWTAFSVLADPVHGRLQRMSTWSAIAIGVTLLMVIVGGAGALWATAVARTTGLDRRPLLRTTLRTAVPLAPVVGLAVDASQLLIDVVRSWFGLAVHVLFAVSFATGLSVFFGVLTVRLVRAAVADAPDTVPRPRVAGRVVLATTVGVALGAVVALPLGWEVRLWMGERMLLPLYLVLATGSAGAGVEIGRVLLAVGRPRRAGPASSVGG